MKQIKLILYLLFGVFTVLLDVSFFSNFEKYGASILSSFIVMVIMAIKGQSDDYTYFALLLVILFAIFSSLPLGVIALNFFFLPIALNIITKKYFPTPNNFTILFYLIAASFLFDFILLVWSHEWNAVGFLAVGYFTAINSMAGWLAYYVFASFKKRFSLSSEIKI